MAARAWSMQWYCPHSLADGYLAQELVPSWPQVPHVFTQLIKTHEHGPGPSGSDTWVSGLGLDPVACSQWNCLVPSQEIIHKGHAVTEETFSFLLMGCIQDKKIGFRLALQVCPFHLPSCPPFPVHHKCKTTILCAFPGLVLLPYARHFYICHILSFSAAIVRLTAHGDTKAGPQVRAQPPHTSPTVLGGQPRSLKLVDPDHL